MAKNMRLILTSPTSRFWLLCLVMVMALSGTAGWWPGAARNDLPARLVKQLKFVPGELLVRFRSAAIARRYDVQALRLASVATVTVARFEGAEIVPGLRLARVREDETAAALPALNRRPDVLYAEPNYLRYAQSVPNDPSYAYSRDKCKNR